MNYQTANQDEISYSHKTKATFRPLSWKRKKKKKREIGERTTQHCCGFPANGIRC